MWFLAAGSHKSWGYWYIDNGNFGGSNLKFLWPNGTINNDLYGVGNRHMIFKTKEDFVKYVNTHTTGWFKSKKEAEKALRAANNKVAV